MPLFYTDEPRGLRENNLGANLLASNAVLFGQQIDIVSIAFQLLKNKANQRKDLKTSEVGLKWVNCFRRIRC